MLFCYVFLLTLIFSSATYCVAQIEIKNTLPQRFVKNIPYHVTVTITKNDFISHFAKYQLHTPKGFTVNASDCKDGAFSFENQIAKIVWVSIPTDSSFTIAFDMTATQQANTSGRFIEKFIFLEDKKRDETKLKIKQITVVDYNDSLATELLKKTIQPIVIDTTQKTEFRLQLGAFKNKPSLLPFVSLLGVRVENREGLYRIYYGSFNTKNEATQQQKIVQKKGFENYVMEIKRK